jgi:hypothetical protein
MPLHIFLGDDVPLYFIEQVEVIEVQICFKFKLVCNLQKGLKFYKRFSIFLTRIGPNSGLGPAGLLPRADPTRIGPNPSPGCLTGRAPPRRVSPTRLVKPNLIAR